MRAVLQTVRRASVTADDEGSHAAADTASAAAGALSAGERMWRTLSDAIDAVAPADREQFLTRLSLLLALDQRDPGALAALVAEARRPA